jgi:uncharacterized protein YdeI (BOF family)
MGAFDRQSIVRYRTNHYYFSDKPGVVVVQLRARQKGKQTISSRDAPILRRDGNSA